MLLPRVKRRHEPHRLDDGTVRIGGEIYGLASEITDPLGGAWAALSLMDGTRTPDDIAEIICGSVPGLSAPEAREIVSILIDSGHVEDASAQVPDEISVRERDRYGRSQAFFHLVDLTPRPHAWEAQLRLKKARVVVLGLGGTGSHAAWALAATGVGRIHCVDADVVELSNLNRQVLYTEDDIGRMKVDIAMERLRQLNSDIEITGESRRVDGEAGLRLLLEDCDVLALCADEPRGRGLAEGISIWANRVCASLGVPWVGGGYNGPLVTVGTFERGRGACFECLIEGEARRRRPDLPVDLGGPGVLAISAGISGQLVAHAVISLITGVPQPTTGTFLGLNLIAPEHHVWVRHPPRPDCPVCAPSGLTA
ncbi:thiamine/molybdopterin biosynthesis protein [Planotetraspora silvatica]|uniref:Thiamine/molybdopterin biosynthesis protein n=1 Tax=Planotetraspora silvatica TaxID=234614 RepID=A0A8J3XRJ8_9ACTN|nr:ThiF family adenylyltransferase [Planotetraspora silvatica]GII46233.1 thiamine/molybdopterin biosynthesis protein [Planotetraspora silvatica]